MMSRKNILIASAIFAIVAAGGTAGYYGFWRSAGEPGPAVSPTPSPEITVSPAPSPQIGILQGRVIDVYADRNVVTLQTADGKEEIIVRGRGTLPDGLSRGNEVRFSGSSDAQNGIFAANALTRLASGTLTFAVSLDDVKERQDFSDTLYGKAVILDFGQALGKPKPLYLVIMDPMGRILTPFRNEIPSASYTVEGSVATLADALKSTQRIRIADMTPGLWTIKLVILPGADMKTIFGFDPGLKPKPLSEFAGKLWYFGIGDKQ